MRSYDSAQRLRKMLSSKQPKAVVPSILPLTLLQPFKKETEGKAGQVGTCAYVTTSTATSESIKVTCMCMQYLPMNQQSSK